MTSTSQSSSNQTEIIMKTDMADLRDIYFGTRKHVYFFGPKTKTVSSGLVITLIVFPFLANYALNIHEGGLLVFACLCLISATLIFWSAAKPIIEWKKSINEFLAMAEKVKSLRIIYNDEFILHIQDESEIKLNWTVIQYAIINDRTVSIYSDITNILLPKSSMTSEEYTILCDRIMEKVQEVQKN
ncbi:hypothetical protein [Fluviicola sp.]|uniref:hypothetical protein n=1 Tax=Fluviicola sp. TaxID=1917219 RepID=UPI003D2E171E